MKKYFFLSLIILLAFVLRIYKITEVPPGFFCDEAAIGYNAYKLLTTGKDEYGVPWPIFFRSFGDYRTPIPIYSNIPSIALFGLTEFAVRFTTAIYGVGTVLILYFIGKNLGNARLGFLSAVLLSVSPWHLHMSRWGSEYASFPFYLAFGFLLFLLSFSNKKLLVFSFIIFGLGMYSFYPAWVVVPLFLMALIIYWLFSNKLNRIKIIIGGIIVFSMVILPLLQGMREGYILARWNSIQRTNLSLRDKVERFYHYYLDHFGEEFLFTRGDIGYPGHFITRHSIRGMGELYIFQAPLILIGLISLVTKKRKWLLVLWLLLLYPLGTALTIEGPFATRSIIGVIPLTLLSALGVESLFSKVIKSRLNYLVGIIIAFTICLSVKQYLLNYYKEYPLYSSDPLGWQYGPRDIIKYFISVEDQYDELYYSKEANAPQIFLPFYTLDGKLGCRKCALGNIKKLNLSKKQLFAASPFLLAFWGDENYIVIKELYYPNGNIAFQIVRYYQ